MRTILVVILAYGVGCALLPLAAKGGDSPATKPSATQGVSDAIPAEVRQAVDQALATYPRGSGQRFKALEAALADWVKASPLPAYEWAEKLPNDTAQRHDVGGAVVGLWARSDFPGLSDYLIHLPNNKGYVTLAFVLAGRDPVAASAWAAKLPKDKWPMVMGPIGEVWGKSDPVALAAWIDTLPPEQGAYGYGWTASMWGFRDPHAAAAWVEKLPEGDARTDAVARLAGTWLRRLPQEPDKIKEWVRQMPIPEARKTTILEQLDKKK